MTLIGIDYGSKRVGVSASDDTASMAFPVAVIQNSDNLINDLKKIALNRKSRSFVLGESKNFKGEDNEVMEKINDLKAELEKQGFKVFFEPEFMTSTEAAHLQGEGEMIDASAATIILQSFLDKKRNKNS